MYTIYTDKSEDFKCKIGVEGTKLSETTARLVIESKGFNLLFEGSIDSDGNCVVPIKKMKNLLSEGESGKMKLEVIAEETFFSPWEDEYLVETNKKVTVEVVEKKETIKESKIKVQVQSQTPTKKQTITEKKVTSKNSHGKIISEFLTDKGITLSNLGENKTVITKLIKEYSTKNELKLDTKKLIDEIIENLKF